MAVVYPPPLRRLLRDAEWVARPVDVGQKPFADTIHATDTPPSRRRVQSRRSIGLPMPSMASVGDGLGLGSGPSLMEEHAGGDGASGGGAPSVEPSSCYIKMACHVEHGVGILLSDGLLTFWCGHLSVSGLTRTLAESFPSVQLPVMDVLRLLEACPTAADGITVIAPTLPSVAGASLVDRQQVTSSRTPLEVLLRTSVDVLQGYSIALQLHMVCHQPAAPTGTTASAAEGIVPHRPVSRTAKRPRGQTESDVAVSMSTSELFREMLHQPRQAQLVALAEAVLLLCQETRRSPESVAQQLMEQYQSRYAETVSAARKSEGAAAAQAVVSAHQATAAALLRALPLPPALVPFLPFATDLLRLAKGEATQLATILDDVAEDAHGGCPAGTPAPAPLPTEAFETAREGCTPCRVAPHPGEMADTPVGQVPSTPSAGPAPATALTALKRFKKIRRVFS